jgi:hypothetical protein
MNDAPAVFPLGETIVTWTATDFSGNTSTCTQVITIVDTTPPVIKSLTASPNNLWPPNHEMVPVTVTCVCEDICDISPVSMIVSVASSQPANDTGDGNTAPDCLITGDLSVDLRAERSGNDKQGRIYTITVECTDFSGNSSRASVNVIVPHDKGKKNYQSKYYNSATYYNLASYSVSSYNNASQVLSITPAAQPLVISTPSKLSVNVNNVFNTNLPVKTNKPTISVVVNSDRVSDIATGKQAKAYTSFTTKNFPPSNPLAQAHGNFSTFGIFNSQKFLSGKTNWTYSRNNNWSFGRNNNWSLGNLLGNNWGRSQNPYNLKMSTSFNFSSGSSFSFLTNNGFNNLRFP